MSYFRVVNDACFSSRCEIFETLKNQEDKLGKAGSFTIYSNPIVQFFLGLFGNLKAIPVDIYSKDGKECRQIVLYANKKEYNNWKETHGTKDLAQSIFSSDSYCNRPTDFGRPGPMHGLYRQITDDDANSAVDHTTHESPNDLIKIDF